MQKLPHHKGKTDNEKISPKILKLKTVVSDGLI
jgi:hypothetical protein